MSRSSVGQPAGNTDRHSHTQSTVSLHTYICISISIGTNSVVSCCFLLSLLAPGSYGECVITSNNDCCVRIFDIEGCRPRQRVSFPFAVNYATVQPDGAALGGGPVAAVVGDDPLTWLIDCRSGLEVSRK